MIQIRVFRHPGIKILQGNAAAVDHFAFLYLRRLVLQDVTNCLGDDSTGSNGIGEKPRLDHITDGKYFGIGGQKMMIDFDESIRNFDVIRQELEVRHVANGNNHRFGRDPLTGLQCDSVGGNLFGEDRPFEFSTDGLGRFSFFTKRGRLLYIE